MGTNENHIFHQEATVLNKVSSDWLVFVLWIFHLNWICDSISGIFLGGPTHVTFHHIFNKQKVSVGELGSTTPLYHYKS